MPQQNAGRETDFYAILKAFIDHYWQLPGRFTSAIPAG